MCERGDLERKSSMEGTRGRPGLARRKPSATGDGRAEKEEKLSQSARAGDGGKRAAGGGKRAAVAPFETKMVGQIQIEDWSESEGAREREKAGRQGRAGGLERGQVPGRSTRLLSPKRGCAERMEPAHS